MLELLTFLKKNSLTHGNTPSANKITPKSCGQIWRKLWDTGHRRSDLIWSTRHIVRGSKFLNMLIPNGQIWHNNPPHREGFFKVDDRSLPAMDDPSSVQVLCPCRDVHSNECHSSSCYNRICCMWCVNWTVEPRVLPSNLRRTSMSGSNDPLKPLIRPKCDGVFIYVSLFVC